MSNYLDPEKVDRYRRDGFVILDGLLSGAEVKRLIEEIEAGSVGDYCLHGDRRAGPEIQRALEAVGAQPSLRCSG